MHRVEILDLIWNRFCLFILYILFIPVKLPILDRDYLFEIGNEAGY